MTASLKHLKRWKAQNKTEAHQAGATRSRRCTHSQDSLIQNSSASNQYHIQISQWSSTASTNTQTIKLCKQQSIIRFQILKSTISTLPSSVKRIWTAIWAYKINLATFQDMLKGVNIIITRMPPLVVLRVQLTTTLPKQWTSLAPIKIWIKTTYKITLTITFICPWAPNKTRKPASTTKHRHNTTPTEAWILKAALKFQTHSS